MAETTENGYPRQSICGNFCEGDTVVIGPNTLDDKLSDIHEQLSTPYCKFEGCFAQITDFSMSGDIARVVNVYQPDGSPNPSTFGFDGKLDPHYRWKMLTSELLVSKDSHPAPVDIDTLDSAELGSLKVLVEML